ncbi:hypothetical protein B0H13DRAFT_1156891 [Mycena leptocephala]|nr:hypothetical protein B0H13DRAFT_1156891 [Mycena leptocephala]
MSHCAALLVGIRLPFWRILTASERTEGRHTRPQYVSHVSPTRKHVKTQQICSISTEHPIYFFPSPFFVNVAFEWLVQY